MLKVHDIVVSREDSATYKECCSSYIGYKMHEFFDFTNSGRSHYQGPLYFGYLSIVHNFNTYVQLFLPEKA